MASNLRLALVTEGDSAGLTGGHLYHRRLAEAAPAQNISIKIIALPQHPFLTSLLRVPNVNAALVDTDAVLIDSLVAARIARLARSLRQRTPLIAIVHQQPGGADHGPLRTRLQARLDLALYARCRLVIVTSSFLAEQLSRAGVTFPIVVIPPGRDDVRPATLPLDLRRGREAAVVCVSNWTGNKSLDLLLEAVAHLDSRLATLHLVGNPDAEPSVGRQLRARIARDDLRDRVVVHGSLPPDEVAAMLAAADVFVHPSRHEAYGSAINEAMAAGLPVVAFRVDNVPMLVREGVDGILLRYGEVAGLAAALAVLIRDPDRRRKLGEAAREHAMSRPTWGQTVEQVFAAVRRAVASPA